MEAKNMKESSHWWWFDSHNKGNSNRSPWLQSTLAELDEKTKTMLRLIEEDADSFAQRAEMYYRKRPQLVGMVEDFYRTHRSLAERYDQAKSEPLTRVATPWSSPLSFTKYRLEKSLSLVDKLYDSYSEAYGPDESDESEVDDPEEQEEEEEEVLQDGDKYETGDVLNDAQDEELVKLKEEVERLIEENKVQKDQLMQKDEEKREVIRQLSLAMDLLRDENVKLREFFLAKNKNTPTKDIRVEHNNSKDGFFGRFFNGFGKSPAHFVPI